jgi:pimeloyl-ACP methyl ester carboxylesterase
MSTLGEFLKESGYHVWNVDYASTTQSVAENSADAIGLTLRDSLGAQCKKIHFVTHSLGGILVRDYLSRYSIENLGRVVMLGPPNQGSEVVDNLKDWSLFKWINGPTGAQLGTDARSVPKQLGPVDFELGVIAGSWSINWINSMLIPGPDDGKVSVQSTKIKGMQDHIVLPTTHPMMMTNKDVLSETLEFLQKGRFKNGQFKDL